MSDETRKSLEGWAPEIPDERTLKDVIAKAQDYRGDVTCELTSGEQLKGYLFNRNFEKSPAYVEIYPASDGAPPRRLELTTIRSIRFTGRDTADGRSWEAWVQKWEEGHRSESAGAGD